MADLTILTAERPARLSKMYTLENDELVKLAGGQLSRGCIEIASIDDLGGLARIITRLAPAQALAYGVPRDRDAVRIAASDARRGERTITRTEKDFRFATGRSVMMMDYDPEDGAPVLSRDDLHARIIAACPGLSDVQALWVPSSSSHVCRVGGNDLTGLRGQRLYILVEDGTDIPRAGKVLVDRLWLADEGFIKLSKAGSMLERTLVDGAVWQASRMDFAAGAAVGPGLEQRRGEPVVLNTDGRTAIDGGAAFVDLTEEERTRVDRLKSDARYAVARDAADLRVAWLDGRRAATLCALSDGADIAEDRAQLERMLDGDELSPDVVIFVEREPGSGAFEPIRVRDVCVDPDPYIGCRTLDPLEPDYNGHCPVGKIFRRADGTIILHSFAHGSRSWTLVGQIEMVAIQDGPTGMTTTRLLDKLRARGPFFDFGDGLVSVSDGRLRMLDEAAFDLALSAHIHLLKNSKGTLIPVDPPARLLKQVLSAKSGRRLRPLKGLSDRPIVRPDGTIVARPGFDVATAIYVAPGDPVMSDIPQVPEDADVLSAIDTIWAPIALFPYVDASSRGAALAAMITAALIDCFPTAPAFLSEGPVRGAGKTLLMESILALGAGRPVGVTPMPKAGDEAEMQKTITSAVHPDHAAKGLIFDNCSGLISSDALAALVTGETFTGRILGTSRLLLDVPARIFVGITGTNLELDADLGRRFLSWRLDPNCEIGFTRRFEFKPLDRILETRSDIIAGILTLVRASQMAQAPDNLPYGSFEVWDGIARRAVLHACRLRPDLFADPVAATIQRVTTHEVACEHHAFVKALAACFGDTPFEARDVARLLRNAPETGESSDVDLTDIFRDLGRRPEELSTKSIGRHLSTNRDRWSGNLVLRSRTSGRSRTWWIEGAAKRVDAPTVHPAS